ncbi:hypothetical protein BLNAU_3120 [Blattamonas nauphoetae]|uniref:Uncharacterized protein n=1 Tax=Blattamonas nauphoetae TaxID=2049346 RepID=A0ABQ9YEC3_9EUKA|nr:hypothetical protein BLNAU_3120 [Blattamonas nauphoetae]
MAVQGAKGVHKLTSFKIISTQETTTNIVQCSFCYKQVQLDSWRVAASGRLGSGLIIIIVLVRRWKKEKAKEEKKPMLTEMDGILDDLKVEVDQTWPGHAKASTDNILGLIEDTDGRLGLKHIEERDNNDTTNFGMAGIRIAED